MTNVTTQINITAKDSTAAAFASADQNLSGLSSTALKVTGALAAVGVSVAGVVSAVKGVADATIQFQQFTSTLQVGTGSAKGAADALSFVRSESQRLGLDLATAADQFGKLTAASKGTALEGKATRDIFTSVAQAATALGLSAEQTGGSLLAIQQIISKGTVSAEELRGQLGERLPGAFQIAARAIGVTTQELDKLLRTGSVTAEQLLPALSRELDKTFGSQSEQAAKGLTAQMNRMNTAIFDLKIAVGESGLINFLSSGIELATKLANALTGVFGGQKLDPIQKQISLIKELEEELIHIQGLNSIIPISDFLFSKKDQDDLKFRIEAATEDLQKMKEAIASDSASETVVAAVSKDAEKLSVATKKTISDAERFLASLKKEAETAGLTSVQIKRLEAAHLGVSKAASPLISRIEQVNAELDQQKASAKSLADDLQKIASITESVKTKEERLIDTQTELNRLLNLPNSNLSIETYNRALKKAQEETSEVAKVTRSVADETSQLWIQAGRNIQSALANSIFNFFDDGLKGMVKSVGQAVGRIASEFAALKIAQSIGLADMFSVGVGGGSGGKSGKGGIGISAIDAAGMGSNLLSLARGGFGATGLIGGGIQSLGSMLGNGSLAAFGGGFAGDAIGGLAAGGFSSGAASAASMGSQVAAFAGPAVAVAAVDQIVRMLAGDKKLGGLAGDVLNFVPVLGPLINGLFGRGPLKQKETSLTGSIGSGGFESGSINTNFVAKGGLFRSNKNDFARVDLVTGQTSTDNDKLKAFTESLGKQARDIIDIFNDTAKGVSGSIEDIGKNLGISTDSLSSFNREINLVSEKGKFLTEEQISAEIAAITDQLVTGFLPSITDLAKRGETSAEALQRLNSEFLSMSGAAQNLGATVDQARSLIQALSFEQRTQFVEMAGGFESLATMSKFFFDNFLSAGEQAALKTDQLNRSLTDLGVSTAIAVEDYKKLIQAEGTASELRIALLRLAPAFLEVRNAQVQLGTSTNTLAKAERSLNDIRNELLGKYNQERGELESTISKFKGISDKLKDFREGLAFSELSPLTPAQKLEQARADFNQTRIKAASGDESALDRLPTVAQEFLRASQTYNASSAAYLSDFALVTNVLKNAEKSALSQSDIARSQLDSLKSSVDYLLNIDNTTKTTNDLLKELIAATLSGGGNPAVTTGDIRSYLDKNPNATPQQVAAAATKFGVSNAQLDAAGYNVSQINRATGGASVTDKQILDFVNANKSNPMAIYNAARQHGITSQRLASVTGVSLNDINKFVKDNKLPAFERGTDFVRKTGLGLLHKAEAVVPSSAVSKMGDVAEAIASLEKRTVENTAALIKVIDITNKQNAQTISGAVKQTETKRQWSDRNKVRLA
jgi:tape measure domain-containing protein